MEHSQSVFMKATKLIGQKILSILKPALTLNAEK